MADIKLDLPEPLNNVLNPVAKRAGTTLEGLWDFVFGGVENYFAKKHFKREIDLRQYKEAIERSISQIPNEKIMEPPLSIIGPALEASKYYIEEETLRNMFASVIAASMNFDKKSIVHHSFVEIIKQLSPLDAENLAYISHHGKCAIYQIKILNPHSDSTDKFSSIVKHLFVKTQADSSDRNRSSLYNLERLGLCNMDYTHFLSNDDLYKPILDNYFVVGSDFIPVKGVLTLTSLGFDLANVCL